MRILLPVAVVAAAALGLAACDKPQQKSAYNNSGASATPAMPATQYPSDSAAEPSKDSAATQAPAVSDTASPNTAPAQPK